MRAVFADTFYFLALLNRRDAAHAPLALRLLIMAASKHAG